jgi:hypothetical protein
MSTYTVVAFDVDGCLRADAGDVPVADESIRSLLVALAAFSNTHIRVWSGSGELYARQVARELGVAPYVDSYSGKPDLNGIVPDIVVDDQDVNMGTVNLIKGSA